MAYYNEKKVFDVVRTVMIEHDVPTEQATTTLVIDALHNINNARLSNEYTALYNETVGGAFYQIKYNGEVLTEQQAIDYMEFMSGSKFLPTYKIEKPQNSIFIFDDLSMYLPQYYGTTGLILYRMKKLASKEYVDALRSDLQLEINNLKSIVYDTVASVEEYDDDYAGILPNPTSINSKPVIDETKCQVAKIFGNSVVVNQLVKKEFISGGQSGLTYTWSNGKLAVSGTAGSGSSYKLTDYLTASHKYLILCNNWTGASLTEGWRIAEVNGSSQNAITNSIITPNATPMFALIVSENYEININIELNIIDLTQYFGSNDNIPTALLNDPTLWYKYIKDTDYNVGALVDSVVNKIASFDSSDNKLGEILINQTLKGAISVHDVIEFVEQENGTFNAVKTSNVDKVVDLGTLNWTTTSYPNFYQATLPDLAISTADNVNAIISKGYACWNSYGGSANTDKTFYIGGNPVNQIYINDSLYATVEAFKTAMSGVMLNYQLATPTTEVIATGLTLDEVAFLIKLGGYIEVDSDEVAPNIKLAYIVKDFQE